MGAAKYEIKTQDRSMILPAMDGIYAAAVIVADKGPEKPILVTNPIQFFNKFGMANPANGASYYSILTYLSESNKIFVARATPKDAKYSAALVRSKIDSLPTEIPNGSWVPDRIVSPLKDGLTQEQFDSYVFPVYHTDRAYVKLTAKQVEPTSASKKIRVSKIDEFVEGDRLYLGTSPQNDSLLYEVTKVFDEDVNYDKLTLDNTVTVKKGDKIRMVHFEVKDYETPITLTADTTADGNTLTVSGVVGVKPNDIIVLEELELVVQSASDTTITIKGTVGKVVNNNSSSTKVLKKEVTYREYQGSPKITRDMTGSNEILISKSDFVGNGDKIAIGDDEHLAVASVGVAKKDTYTETHHFITLDNKYTGNTDTEFHKMIKSEFEDRDSFLVTFNSRSKLGKDVSIAIAPSKAYTEEDVREDFTLPFNLIVYYKGVQVEIFENLSMNYQTDSFGNQMFIENRINGVSEYIQIKVNPMNFDEKGTLKNPLYTNYSIWRKLPEDLFWEVDNKSKDAKVTITEDLLAGDLNIRVTDNTNISMGDRIKFEGYDEEYKIVNKSSFSFGGKVVYDITLDREIIITADNAIRKIPNGTKVTRFDASVEKTSEGIYAGVRHYRPSKIDNVFYNYPLNVLFTISGEKGTLLDSGANLLLGGSAGSPVTVGDLVRTLKQFYNKDKYPVNLIMDSGHTYPAYAQEINSLCMHLNSAHGYISIDINAEKKADYTGAIVDYYNKLMLNSEFVSVFSGWVKTLDENNNVTVYTDPASAAAASQAFTSRNYYPYYPSAGWARGKVKGLGLIREFTAGDMDYLVDNRINPIRYKEGSGLVIWGNETTYRKPSPLQMRSVAWLLIMIKYGLENSLDFTLFELNNERTYGLLESSIRTFMRDEIKAKGAVYDYQCEVSKIITDSDKEQRRIPVFLGIKPTSDTKFIPVTIAIFSASQKIDVSL